MFYGPATPAQFENISYWRKRSRRNRTAVAPAVPEPRRDVDELEPESLDLYALSVGRASVR
jgi:hypothetical protein